MGEQFEEDERWYCVAGSAKNPFAGLPCVYDSELIGIPITWFWDGFFMLIEDFPLERQMEEKPAMPHQLFKRWCI